MIRACLDLRKHSLQRLTGFLTGRFLLRKHSRNLNLVEYASYRFSRQGEETTANLFRRCDPVMIERSKNLGQYQIVTEVRGILGRRMILTGPVAHVSLISQDNIRLLF